MQILEKPVRIRPNYVRAEGGVALILGLFLSVVFCARAVDAHEGFDHHHHHQHHQNQRHSTQKRGDRESQDHGGQDVPHNQVRTTFRAAAVSGSGEWKFRAVAALSSLPPEVNWEKDERRLHGGFAVDRRPGKGQTYTYIPGHGLLRISSDLTKREIIPTPEKLRGVNWHNLAVWGSSSETLFAIPSDSASAVYVGRLEADGLRILNTMSAPKEIESALMKATYSSKPFKPTDTEFINGRIVVWTGYDSRSGFGAFDPSVGRWIEWGVGGRGGNEDQWSTAHGGELWSKTGQIVTADREKDRYVFHSFAPDFGGKPERQRTLPLPKGCRPCDVAFLPGSDSIAAVACLNSYGGKSGAPVLVIDITKTTTKEAVLSEIWPRDDLGLDKVKHIHNVTWRVVPQADGSSKIHLVCQAWNPGLYFVLEPASGKAGDA